MHERIVPPPTDPVKVALECHQIEGPVTSGFHPGGLHGGPPGSLLLQCVRPLFKSDGRGGPWVGGGWAQSAKVPLPRALSPSRDETQVAVSGWGSADNAGSVVGGGSVDSGGCLLLPFLLPFHSQGQPADHSGV